MSNYYDFIPHEPNFPYELFARMAAACSRDDILVEVGALFGHGTCYMADRLRFFNKKPKFYALDPWDEPLHPVHGKVRTGQLPWLGETYEQWRARGASLYDAFEFYISHCPAREYLYDYAQFPCLDSHGEFKENTLFFAFLNYSRTYPESLAELMGWWPKVKTGGVLGVYGIEGINDKALLDATGYEATELQHWGPNAWSICKV